ncbi:MAG: DNA repair protein RecO [Flavobacterium sp. BFFFF1]|uniref:DNA repair protein RecO n=1 Tax=unclassified Flavobacterium TaxID=196869 RepID=UPI000BD2DAF5|nr:MULTISPECIES: DNA repair protein RecO [unclassified Flavobacterium]OYU81485.1 MAG: DNA repair protein RecO [Flavobacterium sp. BFFFF1]
MLVKTRAIVISSLKYQDKNLIVKCFTESDGLKSYFVRSAFSSSKNNQKMAYFQPMTLLEIEASHKNKGTLEHFREVRLATHYHSIPNDVVKSTITLFIAEMLHHSIHEEEKNEALFDFLYTAMAWLDNHKDTANFHLILLLEMTKFLGFYPDVSRIEDAFLDVLEGVFTDFPALNSLSEPETALFKKLLGLRFEDGHKAFHVSERQVLLRILIDYYSLHLDGFKKPKSLEVLREVFS